MHVVKNAQDWLRGGGFGQQAQGGQRDQEPVGRTASFETECNLQGPLLWWGYLAGTVQDGPQELMQRGVGQGELGLHTRSGQYQHAVGALAAISQQRGFADARFAPQDEAAASTGPRRFEQSTDGGTFPIPRPKHCHSF
jgi:hypothetical protein